MNPKPNWTITRKSDSLFAGSSDVFLSDGTYLRDDALKLDGNALRSHEQKGFIRVGGLVRLTLGPVSFAKVHALRIGESTTL